MRLTWVTCVLSLAVVGITGCNGDNVRTYPVSGTITFDGKPMKGGGSISFIPTEDQKGKAPGGTIDEDGNYVLSTYKDGDGAMSGKFRVAIVQTAVEEPEATPDGTPRAEAIQVLGKEALIPQVYSDFKNSPLTVTVEEKPNELNFDLKRDAISPEQQAQQQQRGA